MRSGLAILLLASALAAVALASATADTPPKRPHILELQYYEDLEDGPRYNVTATVTGEPEVVRATHRNDDTTGRLSHNISPSGRGKSWFFRDRGFVRGLRADLRADGVATVDVQTIGLYGIQAKRCSLVLEPDPVYGDFAGGECHRIAYP